MQARLQSVSAPPDRSWAAVLFCCVLYKYVYQPEKRLKHITCCFRGYRARAAGFSIPFHDNLKFIHRDQFLPVLRSSNSFRALCL